MPKLDLDAIAQINVTGYPSPYKEAMAKRHYRKLAGPAGIEDFGISHVMLDGEAVLVEEQSETVMRAGDCAAFPKGVPNGHQLVNRSDAPCTFVAIGRIAMSDCHYPDIDLHLDGKTARFVHKDGSDFETPAEAIR